MGSCDIKIDESKERIDITCSDEDTAFKAYRKIENELEVDAETGFIVEWTWLDDEREVKMAITKKHPFTFSRVRDMVTSIVG